jgi:predicted permease
MLSLDSLLADVRHGVHALGRDRGFSLTALVTFALCLGANVALFAVVRAVLLKPLPFPEPDRLVAVFNGYPKAGVERAGISVPYFLERQAGVTAFAAAAAVQGGGVTLGEGGAPERVAAMNVTPGFFRVLGVTAALGRTFNDEEGLKGKEQVLVLSDGLWREKFGADPGIVGRAVRVGGGAKFTVIGVMPPGFRYLSSEARLWKPLAFGDDDRKPDRRHSNNFEMIARLKPGATIAEVQSQIAALNQAAAKTDPYAKLVADAGFNTNVVGLQDDYVAQTRPLVLLLQAGVLLLLGIGLVNLTNLLLVRTSARAKELSIRQVLGADRVQLARQILAETLILALAGGVLGLGVGWLGLRGLDLVGAGRLPHAGDFQLDAAVCLVALAAAAGVGLLLAWPVLWQTSHRNLASALSVESRGGTTTRAAHRLRHALIVAQFALAFVLLASAGLLGLSFTRVLAVQPGFQADQVLTAMVPLPAPRYKEDKDRVAFVERLSQELKTVPEIAAAGFGSMMPFTDLASVNAITVEGYTPVAGESLQAHYMGGVTGDYFGALRIPLREGRLLTADDTARQARVCVIDEAVARRYWPKGNAIGGRIFNGVPEPGQEPFTVVGIVGTVKQEDLVKQRSSGAVYLPFAHYAGSYVSLVVRTTTPAPETAGPALRTALRRVDPDLPLTGLKPLQLRIDETLVQRRSPLMLAGIFSALALLLAAVGLYGVLAYAVAQRRREIGVRMALGAEPAQIRTQFLALGARLVVAGAVLGGLGAWWSGRAMHTLLFGVETARPVVFGATLAVLVVIALAACLLPAARAASVPPMEALRSD